MLTCSYEELYGWHWNLTPEQLEVESDAESAQPHPRHYGLWMRKALRVAAKAALGGFTVRIGICLLLRHLACPDTRLISLLMSCRWYCRC